MKKVLDIFFIAAILLLKEEKSIAQNVGIGTANPLARLHVGDSSVVFTVPTGGIPPLPRNPPVSGAGRRFMWYADKGAVRSGEVTGTAWDKDNVGNYSAAIGYNNIANGIYSFASGYNTTATGVASSAIGEYTIARALGGFSVGSYNDITDTPDVAFPGKDRVFQIGNGSFIARNNALTVLRDGSIGIGTVKPLEKTFYVLDKNLVVNNSNTIGLPSIASEIPTGPGYRMLWYSDKAAFRAGGCSGADWDKDSIGKFSFATGYNTTAADDYTIAMGKGSKAWTANAIAIGTFAIANGNSNIALGFNTSALGPGGSLAIGGYALSSGLSSTAIGSNITASGSYSTAMGRYVTTNSKSGSFIIGDDGSGRSNQQFYSDVNNQMQMVFAGGYRLYTGNASSGVYMNGGDNSWSAVSDKNKKEKLLPVDGELFLDKISKLPLSSWNYKGQSPKQFRHYGPMAQDFHKAFGKDAYGNIGCDTLINQQDFLGINIIAIQALEKRTAKIEALQKQNAALQQQVEELSAIIARMDKQLSMLAAKANGQNDLSKNKR